MVKTHPYGLFAVTSLFSVSCLATSPATARADYLKTVDFAIHTGYRVDELNWNIAGNVAGTNPNILSELTWDDLKIYQVGASGKLAIGNNHVNFLTCIRGHVTYGWIIDGANQDSDFGADNRGKEWSRSNNLTEDDNVFDTSIGIGFQWKFWQDRLAVAPLGGYSSHQQNLRISNGLQTLSEPANAPAGITPLPLGPFAGLDSTYETEWKGPWAGLDIELSPTPRLSLLATVEYHWAEYEAEANWNLAERFAHPVSFRHTEEDASGIVLKVAGQYLLAKTWALDLSFDYQDWEAEGGIDRIFFANGAIIDQSLNRVNWKSRAISAGLSHRFY